MSAIQYYRVAVKKENNPFISVWKTDNISTGSSEANQVSLPLIPLGNYNFTVDWGDGSVETVTTNTALHTYGSPGTYTITITGRIEGFLFENSRDKLKILDILQWGSVRITTAAAFFGCANLDITAADAPVFWTGGSLTDMFRGCSNLTGGSGFGLWDVSSQHSALRTFFGCSKFNGPIGTWDVSNITSFVNFLNGASLFNQNLNSWNVSKVHSFLSMFTNAVSYNQPMDSWVLNSVSDITMSNFLYGTNTFDQSLASFNMDRVVNANDMLRNSWISTPNYDDTLIAWSVQGLRSGVVFNAGTSRYSAGEAALARQHIIDTFNWTILDGGQA